MSGERVNATVFLEDSDGIERKLPDWLTKHELQKFLKKYPKGRNEYGDKVKFDFGSFTWAFYTGQTKFDQYDEVHNVYGTVYDCQNTPIGKNQLYTFKLEKVLYQNSVLDRRMDMLTANRVRIAEIEKEIEDLANDPEASDVSYHLKSIVAELNILLTQHPDINKDIGDAFTKFMQSGIDKEKDRLVILYINVYGNNRKQAFFLQEVLTFKIINPPMIQSVM